jgi:hypothetical protein
MSKYINAEKITDRILLDKTVWDDVRIPALSVTPPAANFPAFGAFLGAGGLKTYRFDGAGVQTQSVHFTIQIPHTYKLGTNLHPHVHWAPTTTDAGNVIWQLEYSWQDKDGTFGAASTLAAPVSAAGGAAWAHNFTEFSEISGAGLDVSSMLVCRLFRDPTHGSDNYAFDAAFLEFDLHFEVNTLGSKLELEK